MWQILDSIFLITLNMVFKFVGEWLRMPRQQQYEVSWKSSTTRIITVER
jgi:hypothetical protein